MPKQKEFQLSGAKKRKLAKDKVDKERSAVATAQRLDRFLVHSKLSVTESEKETVTTISTSSAATFQNESENSESGQCQSQSDSESDSDHSEAVSEDDQGKADTYNLSYFHSLVCGIFSAVYSTIWQSQIHNARCSCKMNV